MSASHNPGGPEYDWGIKVKSGDASTRSLSPNVLCGWCHKISNDKSSPFWICQFNYSSGQPAPESITDKIYGNTLSVSTRLILVFHTRIDSIFSLSVLQIEIRLTAN